MSYKISCFNFAVACVTLQFALGDQRKNTGGRSDALMQHECFLVSGAVGVTVFAVGSDRAVAHIAVHFAVWGQKNVREIGDKSR